MPVLMSCDHQVFNPQMRAAVSISQMQLREQRPVGFPSWLRAEMMGYRDGRVCGPVGPVGELVSM